MSQRNLTFLIGDLIIKADVFLITADLERSLEWSFHRRSRLVHLARCITATHRQ